MPVVVPSTANYCCRARHTASEAFCAVSRIVLLEIIRFLCRFVDVLLWGRSGGPSTARGNEAEQDLEKEAGSPRPRSLAQPFSLRDVTHNCCAGAFYLRFGALRL